MFQADSILGLSLVNKGKEVFSMKFQNVGQEITTPVYSAC